MAYFGGSKKNFIAPKNKAREEEKRDRKISFWQICKKMNTNKMKTL